MEDGSDQAAYTTCHTHLYINYFISLEPDKQLFKMSIIVFVEITILPVASHPENCRVGSEKIKAVSLEEGREEPSFSCLLSLRPPTLLVKLAHFPSVPPIPLSSTLDPKRLPATHTHLACQPASSGEVA